MKDNNNVPEELHYTKEHEWARLGSGLVVVGITDYAAKTLNDIVYLSLPSAGQEVKQFGSFGTVESIKAVSELYSPFSGKVTKVNSELTNHPELVNQSPYEDGWIIEIAPSNLVEEKAGLLDSDQYAEFLTSLSQ
jgi:glycine cleavage system H protein